MNSSARTVMNMRLRINGVPNPKTARCGICKFYAWYGNEWCQKKQSDPMPRATMRETVCEEFQPRT